MRRLRVTLLARCVAGVLGPLLVLGCGGSQAGASLDDGVFRRGPVAFRVGPVPAEWRAIAIEDADLAWRDEPHRASVLLNARCGRKDDDTPLVALTQHLIMGTTEREIASQDVIPFDAREAMHTRLRAKLDGVPMTYDLYVMKKDGCVYDFVYVGEPRAIEAGVPAFERFVSGFRTLPDGGRS